VINKLTVESLKKLLDNVPNNFLVEISISPDIGEVYNQNILYASECFVLEDQSTVIIHGDQPPNKTINN
jgi:hypothetical protein